ncbi:hypothetical protein PMAYCL1PPCAC_13650, partial [Pristionchus mayeri]
FAILLVGLMPIASGLKCALGGEINGKGGFTHVPCADDYCLTRETTVDSVHETSKSCGLAICRVLGCASSTSSANGHTSTAKTCCCKGDL